MTKLRILSLISAAVFSPAVVSAAITYSGLDAVLGSLDDVTDGTGWHSNGWENQSTDGTYTVSGGSPLEFGNLLTSGNYMNGGGGWTSTGRRLDTGSGSGWNTAGAVSDPFSSGTGMANIDSGEVWASMLVRVNSGTGDKVIQFHSSNIGWAPNDTNGLAIKSSGGGAWGLAIGAAGSTTNTGTSPTIGETALFVTKFELDATGTNNAYLWVFTDPSEVTLGGTNLATGTAHASIAGATTDQLRFKSLRFFLDTDQNRVSVDEIRIGQSFASVTPVPEPSTYAAIAAFGVMALAWFRRRR